MKSKLQKVTSAPKKVATHVYARRGRYAAAAGFIAGGYAMRKLDIDTRAEALAFIEEKGLSDEFFTIGESYVK
jgi:hypothetical protein